MNKIMLVVGKKDNPGYLANGRYLTHVEENDIKLVTFSKKGNLITYKNPKFKYVTVSREDFEKVFDIKETFIRKSSFK